MSKTKPDLLAKRTGLISPERQLFSLLRHGTSVKNVLDRHGGPGADLTDKGKREAMRILRVFARMNLRPRKVYFSHAPQIEQTARIVAEALHTQLVADERIEPLDLGVLSGLSRAEAAAQHPDAASMMDRWRAGLIEIQDVRIPNAEPMEEFWRRGTSFLDDIVGESGFHLVVGSRSILTLLISIALGRRIEPSGGYRHIDIPCCGLVTFRRVIRHYEFMRKYSSIVLPSTVSECPNATVR